MSRQDSWCGVASLKCCFSAIGVAAPKAISPKGYATLRKRLAKGLRFRAYAIAFGAGSAIGVAAPKAISPKGYATLRKRLAKGRPYANAKRGLWPQLPRLCDRIRSG
ncbi:MAG: hypothetical protein F6K55_45135 [Moorea sp. SIO4A3]|nr:hypothetical protein [Moorena sp. SIO4A3]